MKGEALVVVMLEILETDGKMKEDVTWNVAGFIGK